MKTLEYSSLLFVLFVIGCVAVGPYRPMQVGMVWTEWETVHQNLEAGNYIKTSVYTEVYQNGTYQYNSTWSKDGSN